MRALAYVELIRPVNSVMIGVAVLAGYLTGGGRSLLEPLLGFTTGFTISGFSMIINDYFDVEVDRLNKLPRPLVRGDVSTRGALAAALLLLLIGLTTSLVTGYLTFLIASVFALLSFSYNYRVKRLGPPGNVIVASSIAIPFLYGGLLASLQNWLLILVMFVCSFLAGLSREIIKSIADVRGDSMIGVRSMPVRYGIRASKLVSALLILIAVAISYLPVLLGKPSVVYVVGITLADAVFILTLVLVVRVGGVEDAYRLKRLLLVPMSIALITFVIEGLL